MPKLSDLNPEASKKNRFIYPPQADDLEIVAFHRTGELKSLQFLYPRCFGAGRERESLNLGFVYYKGTKVGESYADLVVEKRLTLELKVSEVLVEENEWQLLNYLRSTDMEVGLLLNFGKKPVFKRKVFQNSNKVSLSKNS